MSGRKVLPPLNDCIEWIKSKQIEVEEIDFFSNDIAIEQSLANLRGHRSEINDFATIVQNLKKNRGNVREVRNLEDRFLHLKDLALQKKRCLEELLYITESLSVFHVAEKEIESRALYLTERKIVFDSVYRTQDLKTASHVHKECLSSIRESWNWIREIGYCLDIHTQNAAAYHEFFHKVQYLESDMAQYASWVQKFHVLHGVQKMNALNDIIGFTKDVSAQLLDFQYRYESLRLSSYDVHPIELRRQENLANMPGRALINYSTIDCKVAVGEMLVIQENSSDERWVVKTSSGQITDIPSILVVIPAPCREAINCSSRLSNQILVNYKYGLRVATEAARETLLKLSADSKPIEYERMSSQQTSQVLKTINEAIGVLQIDSSDSSRDLLNSLSDIRKIICQSGNPDIKIKESATFKEWCLAEKMVMLIKDLQTHLSAYVDWNDSVLNQVTNKTQDLMNFPVFSSCAYFEKLKDTELMYDKKSSLLPLTEAVHAQIYIHERNRVQQQSPSVISPDVSKRVLNPMDDNETKIKKDNVHFELAGVVDVCAGTLIPVDEAVNLSIIDLTKLTYTHPVSQETMPLEQAINRGLIKVEEVENNLDEIDSRYDGRNKICFSGTIEEDNINIEGVLDPESGNLVDCDEALAKNLLDLSNGLYVNSVTGEKLPIANAIRKGYIVLNKDISDDLLDNAVLAFTSKLNWFSIDSVIDPVTKRKLSVKRAIMDGILDRDLKMFCVPETQERIPIEVAIANNLVQAKVVDENAADDYGVICISNIGVEATKVLSGSVVLRDGTQSAPSDLNNELFIHIPEDVRTEIKGIRDPLGQYMMTAKEAFDIGILRMNGASYDRLEGEEVPLLEACAQNLIEPDLFKHILKVYHEHSLEELIQQGIFDAESGLITDPYSDVSFTLEQAINQEIIESDKVYYFDIGTGEIKNLSAAIQEGSYDPKAGKFKFNGRLFSPREAQEQKFIDFDVDPEKLTDKAESLRNLRPVMNTNLVGIYDPISKEYVSIEDAIISGIVNIPKALYLDDVNKNYLTLNDAIRERKIDEDAGLELLKGLQCLSLEKAIEMGRVNSRSGNWVKDSESVPLPLSAAVEQDYVNPRFVFMTDKDTGFITSFDAIIQEGKYNPKTGRVIDSDSDAVYTIDDAIKRNIIKPGIDIESCLNPVTSLKKLIEDGKISPKLSSFLTPDNRKYPYAMRWLMDI